jgi:hypothetical protein
VPFDLVAWYGLFAPAGTPPAVVRALNQGGVRPDAGGWSSSVMKTLKGSRR